MPVNLGYPAPTDIGISQARRVFVCSLRLVYSPHVKNNVLRDVPAVEFVNVPNRNIT